MVRVPDLVVRHPQQVLITAILSKVLLKAFCSGARKKRFLNDVTLSSFSAQNRIRCFSYSNFLRLALDLKCKAQTQTHAHIDEWVSNGLLAFVDATTAFIYRLDLANKILRPWSQKNGFATRQPVQCDQMARLFVQYLAIYSNENVPKSKNISQIRFKILPTTDWILKSIP